MILSDYLHITFMFKAHFISKKCWGGGGGGGGNHIKVYPRVKIGKNPTFQYTLIYLQLEDLYSSLRFT